MSSRNSREIRISVNNDSGSGAIDAYSVIFPLYEGGPSLNTLTGAFSGFDVEFGASIYLYDTDGNAWDSVALPDPELVLSLLPSQDSSLSLAIHESLWSGKNLDFMVTDLSVVPTPGAFLLGSLGLMSAGWRLRKRRTA